MLIPIKKKNVQAYQVNFDLPLPFNKIFVLLTVLIIVQGAKWVRHYQGCANGMIF